MSSYWTSIPTAVIKSKKLTDEEKSLYYEISTRINAGGYCTDSNKELAKALGVSEKTITTRLAGLRKKKFANTTLNVHRHQRRIYLGNPGEPSEEPKPNEEQIMIRTKNLQESLKKAIVFGTIDPNILVQRFKESPYLDDLKDNSTQFVLTIDQINFLAKFQKRYPEKKIDCQLASFSNIDFEKLVRYIDNSDFLQSSDNLSLKWLLTHYEEIVSGVGKYKTTKNYSSDYKKNFQGRGYSTGDLNDLFMSIDDIEI